MKTSKVRKLYLDYFKALDHKVFASDSLVPQNDPSVLFTGAGMNQFKAYFLGEKKDVKRAASCQKCIRTADLERVGETAYHHSFFEMLGNFSFGDYFKEEAIQYAWAFVTKELRLPKENLWVSVFENDDEAFGIWKKKIGIDEKRIVRFSAEDNFWPANAPTDGPNGPCGPCSEIYVGATPGKGVEIWNLVFTQYDRQSDGFLKPLPQKNIDTGMGLERLASVLQGVKSNFEIDLFTGIEQALAAKVGDIVKRPERLKAKNALLDHVRAVTFAIADGVTPSNEGRGYVIRKILRKSVLHLKEFGLRGPVLNEIVPAVVAAMGDAYPELRNREKGIVSIVRKEEEGFWNVLDTRVPQAEVKIKRIALTAPPKGASGEVTHLVFEFYDTFGVPKEILKEIVAKNRLAIDEALFTRLVNEQRDRARAASNLSDSIFTRSEDALFKEAVPATEFLGYETLSAKGHVLGLAAGKKTVDRLEKGQKGILVVDRTPFYAEQGGQVGDKGLLSGPHGKAQITDTQWEDSLIFHHLAVTEGEIRKGDAVELAVNDARSKTMKNHTATHLLHAALRKVLGPHVKQNGSLVAPDRLRFDFTHFAALSPGEIGRIESLVNGEIRRRTAMQTRVMDTQEAIAEGAMAFFGEKYGEKVRVVSAGDFSTELCGGTHVKNTGEIACFRIVSESSIQAGVRRMEAVTGDIAVEKRDEGEAEIRLLAAYLGSDRASIKTDIASAVRKTSDLQKRIKPLVESRLRADLTARLKNARAVNGTRVFAGRLPAMNFDLVRESADWLRSSQGPCAVVLSTSMQDKPQIVAAFSKELVARNGLDANALVKEISKRLEGSGGGRPDFAVGGGRVLEKLDEAIAFAEAELLKSLGRA